MGKREFEEYLERVSTEPQIDWNTKKDEWIKQLTQFYKRVEGFFEKYKPSGNISWKYQKKTINEDPIPPYLADEMHIMIKNREVVLDPIGTNLIGAKGRVDMKGNAGIAKFVSCP